MNGCDNITITQAAQDDLLAGYWFYEQQNAGIGSYFLDSLFADIDRLQISAGIHPQTLPGPTFRILASRFPYAIYYLQDKRDVTVVAVLDTRRDPEWLREQQTQR